MREGTTYEKGVNDFVVQVGFSRETYVVTYEHRVTRMLTVGVLDTFIEGDDVVCKLFNKYLGGLSSNIIRLKGLSADARSEVYYSYPILFLQGEHGSLTYLVSGGGDCLPLYSNDDVGQEGFYPTEFHGYTNLGTFSWVFGDMVDYEQVVNTRAQKAIQGGSEGRLRGYLGLMERLINTDASASIEGR